MLKSLLIGLDGSEYSRQAIELGIAWAKKFDALLAALGIIDAPSICAPEPVPPGGSFFKEHRDESRLANARRQVEQFLGQFAVKCAEAGAACKLLENTGAPHEQIVLEAQRYDLILLGQQTYFHFETQENPDETLAKVLKHTPRPVVTVPRQLPAGRKLVVAYDGSLQAARSLQAFAGLGLGTGQEIHLVSVAAEHEQAARCADRAAEFLRSHGIQVWVHVLASATDPAQVLLEQCQTLEAGLLVMGAFGRPGWKEFFLGSTTKTILKESTVPLFLYH